MLTVVLIVLPFVAALLALRLPQQLAGRVAFLAALAELIVSVVVLFHFDKTGGLQFVFANLWIDSLGISFSVGIDGISLLLVLRTTVLTPGIILTAWGDTSKPSSYFSLILAMQAALVGVFVAQDGFLFYLFWEMALIPIYFICLKIMIIPEYL